MSDTVIVGLIAASASIIGTLVSYLKNANTNKKKFNALETGFGTLDGKVSTLSSRFGTLEGRFGTLEGRFNHFETNAIKHVELDPDGKTMQSINSKFAGLTHHSIELNGILKDKQILTNEQAARLNNHLDN
jgi:hypothetical protein